MEEIKIGHYIRTKDGYIGKVIGIVTYKDDENPAYEIRKINKLLNNILVYKNDIVKHSKNIIDLIEVGDIVNILIGTNGNGEKITQKFEILSQKMIDEIKKDDTSIEYLLSILTKEQYEQNSYKIGE